LSTLRLALLAPSAFVDCVSAFVSAHLLIYQTLWGLARLNCHFLSPPFVSPSAPISIRKTGKGRNLSLHPPAERFRSCRQRQVSRPPTDPQGVERAFLWKLMWERRVKGVENRPEAIGRKGVGRLRPSRTVYLCRSGLRAIVRPALGVIAKAWQHAAVSVQSEARRQLVLGQHRPVRWRQIHQRDHPLEARDMRTTKRSGDGLSMGSQVASESGGSLGLRKCDRRGADPC
jgi:hypothetical protein